MSEVSPFANVVRVILTLRGDQNRMFGEPLGAPAWDLIFVLFLAQAEGRTTLGRDATFIAGIDPQVGRRWIAHLRTLGVVIEVGGREADVADGAGPIALSPMAIARIEAFVEHARRSLSAA